MVNEDNNDTGYADDEVPSRHSPTRGCPDWCVECVHEPVRDGALRGHGSSGHRTH